MPKKQRKTVKQIPKAAQKAVDELAAQMSFAHMASVIGQRLVKDSHKLGAHDARAELLKPILENLDLAASRFEDISEGKLVIMPPGQTGVTLYGTSIRLVLSCLAEAGYVPAPKGGEGFALKSDTVWSGVPGDGAEVGQPVAVKTPPVAKAA